MRVDAATKQYPYHTVTEPLSHPLFRSGETLGASVARSGCSLAINLATLRNNGTFSTALKTSLLERGEVYFQSALRLASDCSVAARKREPLWPAASNDALRTEVVQIGAFSQALNKALEGKLSEAEAAALDNDCPTSPSWASQMVTMTGVGCLMLGVGDIVSGSVTSRFIDEINTPYAVAAEVGGAALSLVGMGVMMAQNRYHVDHPPVSDRQLLEALNKHMMNENPPLTEWLHEQGFTRF